MLLGEYKRDVDQNYLVVRKEGGLDTASYQVKMLLANVVPGLLRCHLQNVDGEALLHYEVTSRQPLARVQEGRQLGYEDLHLLFESFIRVMESMGEYLLNPSMLVIDPEYIFTDARQKELYFCYVPGYEVEVREQFERLTEYILPRLDHKDAKAVMLGYAVYRRALEDTFHLEHVKEELYRYREPQEERKEAPVKDLSEGALDHAKERDPFSEQRGKAPSPPQQEGPRSLPPSWEEEPREGLRLRTLAWICASVVFLLLVVAAKLLGFLPWIALEDLLAFLALVMAVCLLGGVLAGKRRRRLKLEGRDREERKATAEGRGERQERKRWPEERSGREETMWPDDSAPLPFQEKAPAKASGRERIWEVPSEERMAPPSGGGSSRREVPPPPSFDSAGETVVLSTYAKALPPTLVSCEEGEEPPIRLTGELTIIGKMEGAADALIPRPTVSRVHARIVRREGEYYLSDLNSRNGTSVNGHMLAAEEEWKLADQDEVGFAEAKYVFCRTP